MTRLVARLILAMLLLPLTGSLIVIAMLFIARGAPPDPWEVVGMWAVVYAFIAAYWILLWRPLVRWTPKRRRKTLVFSLFSVLASILVGSSIVVVSAAPAAGVLVGGGFAPIIWVLATVLIWRETPAERMERIRTAGAGTVSCPICGYNLTGLRESRCPECGTQYTLDELLAAQRDRAAHELTEE